jgi:hypothetical protein
MSRDVFSQHLATPTFELTAKATGGDEIIGVAQYVLQLILCSYDLILYFYVFSHLP